MNAQQATNGKMIKLVLSVLKVEHVQEKMKLIVDVDVNAKQATKGKMVYLLSVLRKVTALWDLVILFNV